MKALYYTLCLLIADRGYQTVDKAPSQEGAFLVS
jgi:hypothetical protein